MTVANVFKMAVLQTSPPASCLPLTRLIHLFYLAFLYCIPGSEEAGVSTRRKLDAEQRQQIGEVKRCSGWLITSSRINIPQYHVNKENNLLVFSHSFCFAFIFIKETWKPKSWDSYPQYTCRRAETVTQNQVLFRLGFLKTFTHLCMYSENSRFSPLQFQQHYW